LYLSHSGKSATNTGDGDGTANDRGNIQGVDYLRAAPANFTAANQVIGNAVIATQDGGSDQCALHQKVLDNRNLRAMLCAAAAILLEGTSQ
jgi:hypothetical protein